LVETCKDRLLKSGIVLATLLGLPLAGIGATANTTDRSSPSTSVSAARLASSLVPTLARPVATSVRVRLRRTSEARHQPHTPSRATISLYEHTVRRTRLRVQGCSAAKRGVGGIVILDFGQPAYNGHGYGTYLFSGRFAGNKAITRAMFAYAAGYRYCLARHSKLRITLARGTSNYHPHLPSAYSAGRKWARETMSLAHRLRTHSLAAHVSSAAADDVEPAWDREFHRTRDFFRGYRDARIGHALYNYGSLDGGVDGIWNARQFFFVTSGMRYTQSIPEIYNHAMAREWAELAHIARHRYHRPLRFAGVMTTHTSRNHGMKPRDAHRTLMRALALRIGSGAADVPATLTNIRAAD
jgi:hypothetical protein